MRILTASALLVILAVPAAAAAAQKETETVDRTVRIGESGRLKLRNFSGDVKITGVSGGDVVIHAVRNATRERLDGIKLDIQSSGSTVTIEANQRTPGWRDERSNVVETSFDIRVPFGTQLDLKSFSGRLEVEGVSGDIEAETFSGRINIDVARAGKMPALSVETFSGDIEARMPDAAAGRVRFNSFSGSVQSDLPISVTGRQRRGDLDGDLGAGGGPTLRFKTFSGDLRIRR